MAAVEEGEQQRKTDDQVLRALEALKKASKDVESNPATADDGGCTSPSMKALLELETGSEDLFSGDPRLSTLSHLLSRLKSLASSLRSKHLGGNGGRAGGIIRSFLRRRYGGHEISRVAGSIGSEIQSWIDRESTDRLITALKSPTADDDERVALLLALEARASQGFDRGLQDMLLRSGAFDAVESALTDPATSKSVRDCSAAVVLALVRFNKDVFVGPVLMGATVRSLVSMASAAALHALNGLIAAIRSPIIDEIHAHGEIPQIVGLLGASDIEVRVLALDTVLEIGYYGRKEAIDAMLDEGLIKRLLDLQRSEFGGALIEMDGGSVGGDSGGDGIQAGGVGRAKKGACKERRLLELRPFASCVARFAIQLEVGEGLRQREKRALKLDVVRRVREAVINDAEAATVLAEVLWGSTCW